MRKEVGNINVEQIVERNMMCFDKMDEVSEKKLLANSLAESVLSGLRTEKSEVREKGI